VEGDPVFARLNLPDAKRAVGEDGTHSNRFFAALFEELNRTQSYGAAFKLDAAHNLIRFRLGRIHRRRGRRRLRATRRHKGKEEPRRLAFPTA
jgi:hypothetical protein